MYPVERFGLCCFESLEFCAMVNKRNFLNGLGEYELDKNGSRYNELCWYYQC